MNLVCDQQPAADCLGGPGPARAGLERFAKPRWLRGRCQSLPLLALLACLSGCGYTVGPAFSPQIRSVHVPIFKSESFRRGYEYELTEAVQKQITSRTKFRLVSDDQADTRLTGRILRTDKSVLGVNQYSDARQLQVNLVVEVTWEDTRTGKILQQKKVDLPPEMVQLTAQSDFAPEVGQSLVTANQQAVDILARNIVDMMEDPW